MNEPHGHLNEGLLQAFLEDELSPSERAPVEAHLERCATCSAEIATWTALFHDLSAMEHLTPSPRLRACVTERVLSPSRPAALWTRLARALTPEWLRWRRAHLSARRIQDLLDGTLDADRTAWAFAHCRDCDRCEQAVEAWRDVYGSVGSLGRLSPSPGFADGVMVRCGQIRVATVTTAPGVAWHLRAARALVPAGRLAWSAAVAIAIGPLIGLAMLLGAVIWSPVVEFTDLLTYASWQVGEVAQFALAAAAQGALGIASRFDLQTVAEGFLSVPAFALVGVLAAWTSVAASGWVLYRHLVAPYVSADRNVQTSR